MIVKLLTEHHFKFLSLKGGCRGSYESTLVKVPHCWKSHDHTGQCKRTGGCYNELVVAPNPSDSRSGALSVGPGVVNH